VLEDEGWTEEKLAALQAIKDKERQAQQTSMQQQQANPLQGNVQQANGGQ
jgi:hypothetical protein